MYCPQCGKDNAPDQRFCRACGLNLGAIEQAVAQVSPSEETASLQRRKRVLEKLGRGALTIAGVIALMSFIFAAALYKLILFGPEVLFVASAIALAIFATFGAGLIGYSRLFLGPGAHDRPSATRAEALSTNPTAKLIEDRPFEPVPSVVENTTDLLTQESRRSNSDND